MSNVKRAAELLDIPTDTLRKFVDIIHSIEGDNGEKDSNQVNVDKMLDNLVLEYDKKL